MTTDLYINEFTHWSYANIIHSLPLYINQVLFKFDSWTLSTYHKAIQKLEQGNVTSPPLPAMVTDPTLSFELDESSKQLWRFPERFGGGLVKSLYQPLLKTDDITISPIFLTVNIRFDLICWFESVYQKLDFETIMMLHFGGIDRWVIPYAMSFDIPFPNALQDTTYLDLSQYGFPKVMIDSLGKELFVFPIYSKPLVKLESISDGSEKYGQDNVANWRSNISMVMKTHILTGLHVISNWQLRDLEIKLNIYPNVSVKQYISHGEPIDPNDNEFGTIRLSSAFEIPPNSKHIINIVDRDVSNNDSYQIDLSSYQFNTVTPLIPEDASYTYDDQIKVLSVSGPLYKGQHIHILLT